MLKKNIKSVISKKFNDFVLSIKDETVRKLVEKNSIITGGCIPSMLLGEPVNDYDVYFRNKETVLAVANYYVNAFNELHKNDDNFIHRAIVVDGANVVHSLKLAGATPWNSIMLQNITPDRVKIIIRSVGVAGEGLDGKLISRQELQDALDDADNLPGGDKSQDQSDHKKEKYRVRFLSTNAISLSDGIQLVIRFYGEPDEIHKNYDFVHCTNYWISNPRELVLRPEAVEAILGRVLIYRGSKYPICSVIRSRKFIKRGWIINAGQYLKMCFQISELDLADISVLEDQLVGVDTVYFLQLVEELRAKLEDEPGFRVDDGYMMSLVDRIFG